MTTTTGSHTLSVTVEFPRDADKLADRMFAILSTLQQLAGSGGTVTVAPDPADTAIPLRPRKPDAAIQISRRSHSVRVDNQVPRLSRREFDLLYFLASHPNVVFSREQLIAEVWRFDPGATGHRTVDVHVRRLRVKLAAYSAALVTVRGIGYRLDGDVVAVQD